MLMKLDEKNHLMSEVIIFTKFYEDRTKSVDFLLVDNF